MEGTTGFEGSTLSTYDAFWGRGEEVAVGAFALSGAARARGTLSSTDRLRLRLRLCTRHRNRRKSGKHIPHGRERERQKRGHQREGGGEGEQRAPISERWKGTFFGLEGSESSESSLSEPYARPRLESDRAIPRNDMSRSAAGNSLRVAN